MKIYFATHATSVDNEQGVASGWADPALSELGKKQARELGRHFKDIPLSLICTSDFKRAIQTVELAFGSKLPVIIDPRLRELNYGDYNGCPNAEVDLFKTKSISMPFPRGESYQQAMKRLHEFYNELKSKYPDKTVLIVGHRATQYGLDTLVNGSNLEDVVKPLVWRPYWEYNF